MLDRARERFAAEAWAEAHEELRRAEEAGGLDGADLEMLATSAYMLGREEEYLDALERAHRTHLDEGEEATALLCAFWIGVTLARRGDAGRAGGWLGRAGRLLDRLGADRVERGYLLLPRVFQLEAAGELEEAAETAAEAAAVGERFADADLFALAVHTRGHVLVRLGRIREGLGLLDEAMVAASAGELSPIPTGIVYCGVILACQEAHEPRRAREWTDALSVWCERQPDLVAFTGRCLVHRAEIMQMRGDWSEGLEEARRARGRCLQSGNTQAAGEACYRQGEIERLRGDLEAAERAYREASRRGWEPQPGMSLLRLAQGRVDSAATAIRRVLDETEAPGRRLALLPAAVEVLLAAGDEMAARAACEELEAGAADQGSESLDAAAAVARGSVELAAGRSGPALASLRRGEELWRTVEAPYEAARARALIAAACAESGDAEAARLEREAAAAELRSLGAPAEAASAAPGTSTEPHGLTDRELEVLRRVAAGLSNREIAAELVISEHTVARHLQNIFAKLGVSSRTAASAYAFERELL